MNVPILAEDGARTGEVTLLDDIFAAKVNVPLMHQAVTAQLAAARAGSHSTKTRGEVRGGGRKPWRQKGTGRARHGSIREPQWVGGGVAHGPKPRDHSHALPKKMKALALRSALSARAAEGRVYVVEDLAFEEPKTKRAIRALEAWGIEGKVLVVLASDATVSEPVASSFRNLPVAHCITQDQLNTYDVLDAGSVVFLRSALDAFQERAAVLPGRRRAAAEPAPVGAAATSDATEETGSSFPGPTPSEASAGEEGAAEAIPSDETETGPSDQASEAIPPDEEGETS